MMAYNGYKDVPDFALPSNIEVMAAIYGQWHKQGTKSRADAVAIAESETDRWFFNYLNYYVFTRRV